MKNFDIPVRELEKEAVDFNQLSSDFVDIATGCDCPMDDSTPKNAMENEFPLATWLLGTSLSQTIRRRFDLDHVNKVAATAENIKAGNYFLSRPFVMATKGEISEQSELIQAWFDFVLGAEGQEIAAEVGLITVQ